MQDCPETSKTEHMEEVWGRYIETKRTGQQ